MLVMTAKYFILIGQLEQKIEITRQILFEYDDFDPQNIFDSLRANQVELSLHDLAKYLQFQDLQLNEADLQNIMGLRDNNISYDRFLNFILPSSRYALRQMKTNTFETYKEPSSQMMCAFLKIYQIEMEYLRILNYLRQQILEKCEGESGLIYDAIDHSKIGLIDSMMLKLYIDSQGFVISTEQIVLILRRLELVTITREQFQCIFQDHQLKAYPTSSQKSFNSTPAAKQRKLYSNTQTKDFESNQKMNNYQISSFYQSVGQMNRKVLSQSKQLLKSVNRNLQSKFTEFSRPNKAFDLRVSFQKTKQSKKEAAKNLELIEDIQRKTKNLSRKQSFQQPQKYAPAYYSLPQSKVKEYSDQPLYTFALNYMDVMIPDDALITPCVSLQLQDFILLQSAAKSNIENFNEKQNLLLFQNEKNMVNRQVQDEFFSSFSMTDTELNNIQNIEKVTQLDQDVSELILYLISLLELIKSLRSILNTSKWFNESSINDEAFRMMMKDWGNDQRNINKFYSFWSINNINQLQNELTKQSLDTLTDMNSDINRIKQFVFQTVKSEDINYKDKVKFFKNKKYSLIHLFEQLDRNKQGTLCQDDFAYVLKQFDYNQEDLSICLKKFGHDKTFTFKEFLKELTP